MTGRSIRGDVEIVASERPPLRIEALAPDPRGIGLRDVLGPDCVDQEVAVGQTGDVVPTRVQRRDREVVVRVDEARDEDRSVEVDHLGIGVRRHHVVAAHRRDAVVVHDDCGRPGQAGVHGEDAASGERDGHQVGLASAQRLSRPRAMTIRWISFVPSPMIINGASRK